jgi:hypothetical protein
VDRGDPRPLSATVLDPGRTGGNTHTGAAISTRLLFLGLAAAALDLGSVYLKAPAAPTGVTVGDWISAAGAYVVLGLYAWVAATVGRGRARPALLLLAAGITYALGTGIHLSANSIHDMLDRTGGADPWRLAYFWDETAGHYLVDAARIEFALALTSMERGAAGSEAAAGRPGGRAAILVGALAYGFIYFATAVEGQTVPIALPFSLLYAGWSVLASRGRRGGVPEPVRGFYTAAAVVSLVLFSIWGVWHRGFPEFSTTGFIPTTAPH